MNNLTGSSGSDEQSFNANEFIKMIDELGIEYYTRVSDGRSGMSHRGLARFVSVNHPSILYWVQKVSQADPVNNDLPECFKPFAGKSLVLVNTTDPEGSKILSDDFCAAVVAYYAAFAPAKNQTPDAKMALLVCSRNGLRNHIQDKTGWSNPRELPPQLPPSLLEAVAPLQPAGVRIEGDILVLDFRSQALADSCLENLDRLTAVAAPICLECFILVLGQLSYRVPFHETLGGAA